MSVRFLSLPFFADECLSCPLDSGDFLITAMATTSGSQTVLMVIKFVTTIQSAATIDGYALLHSPYGEAGGIFLAHAEPRNSILWSY